MGWKTPNEFLFRRKYSQENFQIAIVTENMVSDVVFHLFSENLEIKLQSCSAIFKCAINKEVSDMVREAHGLEQLLAIVRDKNVRDNKQLLAAATGAIWKCSMTEENVKYLDNVSIKSPCEYANCSFC